MTRKSTATTSRGNASNFKEADAFLRLTITDKTGKEHRLPRDLPLHLETWIHEQMIKKTVADPEATFTLSATVHVIDKTPKGDIEL